ncbi:uncharacterized protein EDB93DRAFT_1101917 [Suillus bovinus]|uniref:uncharacterized protein n=1 Tax=Suillus bovinus TaxID=48563 RepID=UPI001B864E9C|nr:uncharacterized protein EDB93DRAFT_1101917 [Suillus bovinus]KAG2155359.1 hypothetical protein EDB93DRAFT_1101917 [Suillus bovinus]
MLVTTSRTNNSHSCIFVQSVANFVELAYYGTGYISPQYLKTQVTQRPCILGKLDGWAQAVEGYSVPGLCAISNSKEKDYVKTYGLHCDQLVMMILHALSSQSASTEVTIGSSGDEGPHLINENTEEEVDDHGKDKDDVMHPPQDWEDMDFIDEIDEDTIWLEGDQTVKEDSFIIAISIDIQGHFVPPHLISSHLAKLIYAIMFSILTEVMKTFEGYITLPRLQFTTFDGPDFTFDEKPLLVTSMAKIDAVLQHLKNPEEVVNQPHEHAIGCGILASEMQATCNLLKFVMANHKLYKKYFSIDSSGNPIPLKGPWEEYL